MASYVTPKKNVEFIFYMGLVSQSTGQFQANPTLAAGDVKVATDDGAPANISTLPTVDADFTKRIKVTLSTSEMNGDNVTIIFSDAAGAEWDDAIINIQTSARQIDDLAYPTTSGRSIDVTAGGEVGLDWANIGSPTTTVNLSGTTVKTATDVETDTADIQSRLPAALTADGLIKADTLRVGGTLQTAGDIIGDTNDIQSRLPAALVSGRIDASVGAMASNTLTAAALATDAVTEIWAGSTAPTAGAVADAVWDEDATDHQTQGSFGQAIGDPVADTNTIYKAVVTDATGATVGADAVTIKAKTDQLTFTNANQVDANIQAVNDTNLTGNGSSTPWGPA